MPCRDGRDDSYTIEIENPVTIQRLDDVTALLCGLCKKLESYEEGGYIASNPKLAKWWKNHKETDKRRKDDEIREKKQNALNKLTKEERKILGLK